MCRQATSPLTRDSQILSAKSVQAVLDDARELGWLQARAAHEGPIDIGLSHDFGDVRGQIVSVGKVIDDVLPSPALIKLLLPLATLILVIGALYVFYKIYDILFKPMIYDKMHRRIK